MKRTASILFLLLTLFTFVPLSTAMAANVGDIITVAGYGNGDNAAATKAYLQAPNAVAFDSSGNLYFADRNNNRIRKVAAGSGIITTVAGTGDMGYSGDGGQATSATLTSPAGVALDGSGNLYIADTGNNRIRKVSAATGIITTVAGKGIPTYSGDGASATLAGINTPTGVAVAVDGTIYIADNVNNCIRKFTEGGNISTVAGPGVSGTLGDGGAATSAYLKNPFSLAVDSSNTIYIADMGNNRIRKVTFATGNISTVAGNGTAGYTADGVAANATTINAPDGVAVDSAGNIYIADTGNSRIRKVTFSSGIISTVAGITTPGFSGDGGPATAAALDHPFDVALDSAGAIYFSDNNNNRIRKITADGNISTVAGLGYGDGGPAHLATLNLPGGIARDGSGNLYIPDQHIHRVRKVDASTGVISTIAGTGVSGSTGDNGPATSARLNNPTNLAFDSAGNLYISDSGNFAIRKLNLTSGTISTVAGVLGVQLGGCATGTGTPVATTKLNSPAGIAFDGSNNLYIADSSGNCIRRVVGTTITTVAGTGPAGSTGDGGSATSAKLQTPMGIAVNGSQVYIADTYNHRIRKFTVGGNISTVAGSGTSGYSGDGASALSAKLSAPYAVAINNGIIYVADHNNNVVRTFTEGGNISTFAGNYALNGVYSGDGGPATAASLAWPSSLIFDASGNLYIADAGNNRIRQVLNVATTTYNVSYNGNGNTSASDTVPLDSHSPYLPGRQVTVVDKGALAQTGKAFSGWNTMADGTGTSYAAYSTFTINADTTLYAQWTAPYNLVYDGNGNTGGVAPVDIQNPYALNGQVVALDKGTLVKAGYAFSGWNSKADGTGTSYAPYTTFTINANNKTLYAQWTAVYNLTYNGNGNTGGTAPVDSGNPHGLYEEVTVLDKGTLVRAGYVFSGWNTKADGSGTSYAANDYLLITADTTLYAIWGWDNTLLPVGWWKLEGNGIDSIGGNNATAFSTASASFSVNQLVLETQTATVACSDPVNTKIASFDSIYGEAGPRNVRCGTCKLGDTSCSVIYDNAHCGDPAFNAQKYGNLTIYCRPPDTTMAVPGKVNQAKSFNGTGQYMPTGKDYSSVPNSITNNFTMEFWAKPTGTITTVDINRQNNTSTDGLSGQRYAIFPDMGTSGTTAGAGVSVGTNGILVVEHAGYYMPTTLVYPMAQGDIAGDGWVHIAVVYNNNLPSLYVNGSFKKPGVSSARTVSPSSSMGDKGVGYGYYAGLLDEVHIFNRALTGPEIQALYNTGSSGINPVPSVSTDSATMTDTTSTFLNGTVNANNGSATVGVQYGLDKNYGYSASTSPATVTGSTATGVSAQIGGLTCGTNYHYRVTAVIRLDVSLLKWSGTGWLLDSLCIAENFLQIND